jgi:hypothetical protein
MSVTVPVVSPNPYADVADLTVYWQAPTDEPRALDILTRASNRLRILGDNAGINTDEKANASPAYFSTIQWVVMEATKRALLTPMDNPPVDSWQQTAGPYSENFKYTNPSGDLWFKKSELYDLGIKGNQKLNSISTSQRDIYSPYESS